MMLKKSRRPALVLLDRGKTDETAYRSKEPRPLAGVRASLAVRRYLDDNAGFEGFIAHSLVQRSLNSTTSPSRFSFLRHFASALATRVETLVEFFAHCLVQTSLNNTVFGS